MNMLERKKLKSRSPGVSESRSFLVRYRRTYVLNYILNKGIYNLSSVMISCVLRILASQIRFESLYHEIFNIDRFLE